MWWILGSAMLIIIVVIILLVFFRGGSEKLFGGITQQIGTLSDCDADALGDLRDTCPCVQGFPEYDGCPVEEPTEMQKVKPGDENCPCSPKAET